MILYGLGIEALTIGSLLANRGKKVLILAAEGNSEDQPFFSRDGFFFDADPCFWLSNDPEGPHPALAELGISLDFQPLDPGLQVVLPRHRLSFHRQEDLFWQEIRREFPNLVDRMATFLRGMKSLRERTERLLQGELASPPRDLCSKWLRIKDVPFSIPSMVREGKPSFSSYLKPLQEDQEVCLMIDALLMGLGGVKGRNCSALFGSLLYSLMREAVCYPSGGTRRIYEALRGSFVEKGGELRSTRENPRLIREGKKGKGLAPVEGGEYLARTLLGGHRLWEIYQGGKSQQEGSRRSERPLVHETLTLFLGVDQEVLPEEMGANLLLVPESAATSADWSPIWITTGPSGDETQAPPGKRALAARVSLFSSGLNDGARREARARQMLQELENFLPFLSQHLHVEQVHLCRSFSMLQPARKWGFPLRIAPLKQMGYPGLRAFSPERNLFFFGDLPIYGIGLRAKIDAGYYWANLLGPLPSKEG